RQSSRSLSSTRRSRASSGCDAGIASLSSGTSSARPRRPRPGGASSSAPDGSRPTPTWSTARCTRTWGRRLRTDQWAPASAQQTPRQKRQAAAQKGGNAQREDEEQAPETPDGGRDLRRQLPDAGASDAPPPVVR